MYDERWPNGYPDTAEIERAKEFLGWAYMAEFDVAYELYRKKYGDLQCWAVDAPDGGLLFAVDFLYSAVGRLEDLEK